jgi:hypothetical protein
MDEEPRTRTVIPAPGCPEFWITCTPGAFPWSAASTPATACPRTSSAFTLATALVTSARLAVP